MCKGTGGLAAISVCARILKIAAEGSNKWKHILGLRKSSSKQKMGKSSHFIALFHFPSLLKGA